MKHKSAIMGFSYLFGLICASFMSGVYSYLLCAVFIISALLLRLIKKEKFQTQYIALIFLVMGLGFGVFGIYRQNVCEPLYNLDGKTLEISGKVISKNDIGNDMSGYIIETEVDGITARISLLGSDTDAEYGDIIHMKARFSLPKNNAVFNEESYYSSKGILLKATEVSPIITEKTIEKSFEYYIYEFNSYIENKILEMMPNDTGGLLCALFLGDKSHISEQLKENIKRSGVSHFTAVSGFHMTILVHIFVLVLNMTPLRNKRRLKFAFLSVIIIAFMFFFKLSPSVVRSGIMLLVYYGGSLFMRRGSTLNSLGFALLLILLVSPYACRDVGLLLSMAGTFGVGVLAPAVNKKIKSERFKSIREMFIGTVCAVYCTLPFSAIFFGGISSVSFITNIIFQPFFQIALTAVIIFTVLSGVFAFPLFLAGIMSELIIGLINFFGGMKYAYLPLDYDFILPWAVTAFIFAAAVYLIFKDIKRTVKAGIITVFTLVGMMLAYDYYTLSDTEVYVYSDGGAGVIAVKHRSDNVIVVTDDSVKAYAYTESFLKNNFLDEASVLCLLGSTKNMSILFKEIPSIAYIAPSENTTAYDISGRFNVCLDNESGRAVIDCKGYIIEINSIKNENIFSSEADLLVVYGYKLKREASDDVNIVYINKRMTAENENEQNAYYESVKKILR